MKFQRQQREEVNVNLTPLIDVVFLLLIFFMVSTTFTKESHLVIDLPEASDAAPSEDLPTMIEVVIDEEGNYSVNGQALVNTQEKTLRQAINLQVKDQSDKPPLIITADAKTPHQAVVTAMDVSGQLGFEKLSITTKQAVE
ncbi:ExbD/TolR family protein [Neptunomonas concharum]|uniref:Biopolymer transporter ExbD n=1 Tax=Neptunomonas concharum TaxID=1031538 RepID=A0A5P1R9T0_9GAMM|nr:biopolymer transporter ExbD [Neptunomonas concharum]QEQ96404.1 biopolymer transporter ExbD [Neptunomonas concharum]